MVTPCFPNEAQDLMEALQQRHPGFVRATLKSEFEAYVQAPMDRLIEYAQLYPGEAIVLWPQMTQVKAEWSLDQGIYSGGLLLHGGPLPPRIFRFLSLSSSGLQVGWSFSELSLQEEMQWRNTLQQLANHPVIQTVSMELSGKGVICSGIPGTGTMPLEQYLAHPEMPWRHIQHHLDFNILISAPPSYVLDQILQVQQILDGFWAALAAQVTQKLPPG